MVDIDSLVTRIAPDYGTTEPHPRAAALTLPDGTAAPAELRIWAAFDNRIPWFLAGRRGPQILADPHGVVTVRPMAEVLQHVCIDSLDDELDPNDPDDAETVLRLRERVAEFVVQHPGWGVVLEPEQYPDWVLWVPPRGEPVVLTYEHESFSGGEPLTEFIAARYLKES